MAYNKRIEIPEFTVAIIASYAGLLNGCVKFENIAKKYSQIWNSQGLRKLFERQFTENHG
jgi:hypothetical protein